MTTETLHFGAISIVWWEAKGMVCEIVLMFSPYKMFWSWALEHQEWARQSLPWKRGPQTDIFGAASDVLTEGISVAPRRTIRFLCRTGKWVESFHFASWPSSKGSSLWCNCTCRIQTVLGATSWVFLRHPPPLRCWYGPDHNEWANTKEVLAWVWLSQG